MMFIHPKAGTLHGLMFAWYFMFLFVVVAAIVILVCIGFWMIEKRLFVWHNKPKQF